MVHVGRYVAGRLVPARRGDHHGRPQDHAQGAHQRRRTTGYSHLAAIALLQPFHSVWLPSLYSVLIILLLLL